MSYVRQVQPSVKLVVCGADWDDVFGDMARVNYEHRPDIKAGHILTLEYDGKFVPLVARGSKSNQKNVIALDSETRDRLGGLKLGEEYEFKIHRANWGECCKWAWNASDPGYRIASKIAFVSLLLGFVGVILGILSFVPRN